MPTQELPAMLVQTAALEIAWAEVARREPPSIAGDRVTPWLLHDQGEDLDINTEADWTHALKMAAAHPDWLPAVAVSAITGS
jgi:hypothetical protein